MVSEANAKEELITAITLLAQRKGLEDIKYELYLILNDYEVQKAPTELTVYQGDVNEQLLKRYIMSKTIQGCTPRTIHYYKAELMRFLNFMNKPFTEVTSDDVKYYLATKRVRDKVSKTTVAGTWRSLSAFYAYAAEVEDIDKTFNRSTLKGKRNYAIVHLMLDVGLRSQEVRHLKAEHLDPAHNLLHIMDSKGNKSRIVLCPEFLFVAISDYLNACGRSSGAVFLSLRDNSELKKNTLNLMFADLKKESGVSRLHPHLLRHTFATSYLVGGGNLEFLRVFMGHSDYTVTKSYSSLAAQCKMLGADIYKLDKIFFERGY